MSSRRIKSPANFSDTEVLKIGSRLNGGVTLQQFQLAIAIECHDCTVCMEDGIDFFDRFERRYRELMATPSPETI